MLEPDEGEMACGEYGPGRLPEPEAILAAIEAALGGPGPLAGKHVIVTAGPTHEPIDPVRVHRQPLLGQAGLRHRRGARRARRAGDPGRRAGQPGHARRRRPRIDVETARADGRRRSSAALPADAAVLVAAVADWRVEPAPAKLKKADGPPALDWQRTIPTSSPASRRSPQRPRLLVGFAAETDDVDAQAAGQARRARAATGSSPTTSRAT